MDLHDESEFLELDLTTDVETDKVAYDRPAQPNKKFEPVNGFVFGQRWDNEEDEEGEEAVHKGRRHVLDDFRKSEEYQKLMHMDEPQQESKMTSLMPSLAALRTLKDSRSTSVKDRAASMLSLFEAGVGVANLSRVLNGAPLLHEDADPFSTAIMSALVETDFDHYLVDVEVDDNSGEVFVYLSDKTSMDKVEQALSTLDKHGSVELVKKPSEDPALGTYQIKVKGRKESKKDTDAGWSPEQGPKPDHEPVPVQDVSCEKCNAESVVLARAGRASLTCRGCQKFTTLSRCEERRMYGRIFGEFLTVMCADCGTLVRSVQREPGKWVPYCTKCNKVNPPVRAPRDGDPAEPRPFSCVTCGKPVGDSKLKHQYNLFGSGTSMVVRMCSPECYRAYMVKKGLVKGEARSQLTGAYLNHAHTDLLMAIYDASKSGDSDRLNSLLIKASDMGIRDDAKAANRKGLEARRSAVPAKGEAVVIAKDKRYRCPKCDNWRTEKECKGCKNPKAYKDDLVNPDNFTGGTILSLGERITIEQAKAQVTAIFQARQKRDPSVKIPVGVELDEVAKQHMDAMNAQAPATQAKPAKIDPETGMIDQSSPDALKQDIAAAAAKVATAVGGARAAADLKNIARKTTSGLHGLASFLGKKGESVQLKFSSRAKIERVQEWYKTLSEKRKPEPLLEVETGDPRIYTVNVADYYRGGAKRVIAERFQGAVISEAPYGHGDYESEEALSDKCEGCGESNVDGRDWCHDCGRCADKCCVCDKGEARRIRCPDCDSVKVDGSTKDGTTEYVCRECGMEFEVTGEGRKSGLCNVCDREWSDEENLCEKCGCCLPKCCETEGCGVKDEAVRHKSMCSACGKRTWMNKGSKYCSKKCSTGAKAPISGADAQDRWEKDKDDREEEEHEKDPRLDGERDESKLTEDDYAGDLGVGAGIDPNAPPALGMDQPISAPPAASETADEDLVDDIVVEVRGGQYGEWPPVLQQDEDGVDASLGSIIEPYLNKAFLKHGLKAGRRSTADLWHSAWQALAYFAKSDQKKDGEGDTPEFGEGTIIEPKRRCPAFSITGDRTEMLVRPYVVFGMNEQRDVVSLAYSKDDDKPALVVRAYELAAALEDAELTEAPVRSPMARPQKGNPRGVIKQQAAAKLAAARAAAPAQGQPAQPPVPAQPVAAPAAPPAQAAPVAAPAAPPPAPAAPVAPEAPTPPPVAQALQAQAVSAPPPQPATPGFLSRAAGALGRGVGAVAGAAGRGLAAGARGTANWTADQVAASRAAGRAREHASMRQMMNDWHGGNHTALGRLAQMGIDQTTTQDIPAAMAEVADSIKKLRARKEAAIQAGRQIKPEVMSYERQLGQLYRYLRSQATSAGHGGKHYLSQIAHPDVESKKKEHPVDQIDESLELARRLLAKQGAVKKPASRVVETALAKELMQRDPLRDSLAPAEQELYDEVAKELGEGENPSAGDASGSESSGAGSAAAANSKLKSAGYSYEFTDHGWDLLRNWADQGLTSNVLAPKFGLPVDAIDAVLGRKMFGTK